jgi:Radical SAM superfamily/4Fe-4S single cluster domain
MKLSGLHLLLTYQCTFECDHCFVWGSPFQAGVMTLQDIREILRQAQETGTVESIYFEGGEPFLYYPVMVQAIREAAQQGFQVGIVSNSYWATSAEDAQEWLRPLAGLVSDLSVSSDLYHYSQEQSQQAENARLAAEALGISLGTLSVAQPEAIDAKEAVGQLPQGGSSVMYRGRAAEKLTARAKGFPWEQFTTCPHEDLREPGRVHLDPFGNLHICQGISLGNLFHIPLKTICETYDPEAHPVIGALLRGGPAELAKIHDLAPEANTLYADACHLCYETRRSLRQRFPEVLGPDGMYGIF